MFGKFKKEPDRLQEEIKRLEKQQQRLKKQATLIEDAMAQPIRNEEKEITRVAKFKLEPSAAGRSSDRTRKRRLRVHHKKLRNRALILAAVILFLGLILWRVLF